MSWMIKSSGERLARAQEVASKCSDEKAKETPPSSHEGLSIPQSFVGLGAVCAQALIQNKNKFELTELESIPCFNQIKHLGFLYEDEKREGKLVSEKSWKLAHQTFTEYFAALYIAEHIKRCKFVCKTCKTMEILIRRKNLEVLMFTAGILGDHSSRLFGRIRYPKL